MGRDAEAGEGTRAREVRKPTFVFAFVLRLGLRVSFGAARALGSGDTCGIGSRWSTYPARKEQRNNEEYEKYQKQDLRNPRCRAGDDAETQYSRDQRDD